MGGAFALLDTQNPADDITLGNFGQTAVTNPYTGLMWDVKLYTQTKTINEVLADNTVGLVRWFPDVYSGIDVSVTADHATMISMTKGFHTDQDYLFLNGFTQYWDNPTGLVSLQSPYSAAGAPINPANITHNTILYNRSENHPFNAFHNLAESFVSFNPTGSLLAKFDIFDRRAAAGTHNAASRASIYYDGTSRITASRFHISELSQFVLAGYYLVGQRRKTYTQGTDQSILQTARLNLDRIFVYATDKVNANDIAVLTFTNDIVQVVTDGAGNYLFDVNGYAILINT